MASEKNFGDQNSGKSRQLATNKLKEKLIWKIINTRMNLINSISSSITCLSLFPSRCSETWHEYVKWSVENMLFNSLARRVIHHEVSSPFTFFFKTCNMSWSVLPFTFLLFVFGDWISFYGDHFAIKGRQKATFWKSELGALPLWSTLRKFYSCTIVTTL